MSIEDFGSGWYVDGAIVYKFTPIVRVVWCLQVNELSANKGFQQEGEGATVI